MSTHTSESASRITHSTIQEQEPAVTALAELIAMLGHLPPAYITIHTTTPCHLDLQLEEAGGFEQWRAALQVAPETVRLNAYSGATWLAAEALFRGVRVHLTGHNLSASYEQVKQANESLTSAGRAA